MQVFEDSKIKEGSSQWIGWGTFAWNDAEGGSGSSKQRGLQME